MKARFWRMVAALDRSNFIPVALVVVIFIAIVQLAATCETTP